MYGFSESCKGLSASRLTPSTYLQTQTISGLLELQILVTHNQMPAIDKHLKYFEPSSPICMHTALNSVRDWHCVDLDHASQV